MFYAQSSVRDGSGFFRDGPRWRHALKLPDAFQLAVALEEGCYALVTHDRDFGTVSDLLVLGTVGSVR